MMLYVVTITWSSQRAPPVATRARIAASSSAIVCAGARPPTGRPRRARTTARRGMVGQAPQLQDGAQGALGLAALAHVVEPVARGQLRVVAG